jgi:hypothetical protein
MQYVTFCFEKIAPKNPLTFLLGRGQEGVPGSQQGNNDSELVPVVEWRPVVVGYRSLKDGSVTNREDLPQVQPGLIKHPLFPMAFPPINSQ